MRNSVLIPIAVFLTMTAANSQQYKGDTQSVDSIIGALYASMSGDREASRDWNRFKNLFAEDAALRSIPNPLKDIASVAVRNANEFVEQSGAWIRENGFVELEIHRLVEGYGPVLHVWSTYKWSTAAGRLKPEPEWTYGINSLQLLNDGNRWWIINATWTDVSIEHPLPEKYLHGALREEEQFNQKNR